MNAGRQLLLSGVHRLDTFRKFLDAVVSLWVPVYMALVYLVREPRRSTAPTSRLIPNENVLSRKGTLRL